MSETNDSIYRIRNEQLESIDRRGFEEELFGVENEKGLEGLIERHPNLLPGKAISGGNKPAAKFVTVDTQFSLGSNQMDVLLGDNNAVPTLVEAKLETNREARRDVVGQILEYAALASAVLADMREELERNLNEAELRGRFDGFDSVSTYVEDFIQNAENDRMRLIIATDAVTPGVRRIVEFLNRNVRSNLECYAVEFQVFGRGDDVIVNPSLVGQTQQAADEKSLGWTRRELREAFGEVDDPVLRNRLMTILEWGAHRPCFDDQPSGIDNAAARFTGPDGHVLLSVLLGGGHETGEIWWQVNRSKEEMGEERAREFYTDLVSLGFNEQPFDELGHTRKLGKLQDLSDDCFERFLQVVADYCEG